MPATVSIKMKERWLRFLKRKSIELSKQEDENITVSDLIRISIEKNYPEIKDEK